MASTTDDAVTAATSSTPQCFLIVHGVSKAHNVGMLARSAVAFGVHTMCLVGGGRLNTHGNHGSEKYLRFEWFATLDACIKKLREEHRCRIVGVEICDGALPVQSHPFDGNTAFMMGNEGTGLSPPQMAACDSFVYIPQHGAGTASLNVAVAASIILHHFAIWAAIPEVSRTGFKFDLPAEKPLRTAPRGHAPLTLAQQQQLHQERSQKKAEGPDDLEAGLGLLGEE